MSAVKERLLGAITAMSETDAQSLWEIIVNNYDTSRKNWDDIEEVDPDEIDLAMIADIQNDPDCTDFSV